MPYDDDGFDEDAQPGNRREETAQEPGQGGPFARMLGLQFESVAAGRSRMRLRIRPELLNSGGTLHGGVLSSLVDTAIAAAIRNTGDGNRRGARQATVDLNVTFLRPIRQGMVAVEGWVIRRGRTLASGEAEVLNDRGELLAKGRATLVTVADEAVEEE